MFIVLVLQDGLRWEIGTDWNNYYKYFNYCLVFDEQGFEIGYKILNILIRSITDSYSIYLIIYAIIFYAIIFRSTKKYSIDPLLSIVVLYYLTLPYLGMNRQFFAVAICLYSVTYIIQKRPLYFILTIAIASCFHISAVLFSIAYSLKRIYSLKFYLIIIIIACIANLMCIASRIESLLPFAGLFIRNKLDLYTSLGETNTLIGSITGIIKRLIWVILALLVSSSIKGKDRGNFYLFFNIYLMGCCFYLLFNNSIFQIFVSRLTIYFNLFEILLIPYIFKLFKSKPNKAIALIILFCYGVLTLGKGIDSYIPIVGYDIFRPYKAII